MLRKFSDKFEILGRIYYSKKKKQYVITFFKLSLNLISQDNNKGFCHDKMQYKMIITKKYDPLEA